MSQQQSTPGTVTVGLYAAARAAAGQAVMAVDAGSLAQVLERLVAASAPDLAAVLPRCSYLIDGTAVHGDPALVDVPPGAQLDVLPPFAGG